MTNIKRKQDELSTKVKFLLKIEIYLVPDLEKTTARVLVVNVSHLYETEVEGDLTIEKDIWHT